MLKTFAVTGSTGYSEGLINVFCVDNRQAHTRRAAERCEADPNAQQRNATTQSELYCPGLQDYEDLRGIKYTLFACCYIFWVSSAVLISVGIYAKIAKEGGAVDSLTADPALLLIVVGSLMFIITFFGCFGALRDALNLLNIFAGILVAIIVLQIAAAALGFVFSDLVLTRTEAVMRRGITTYRDDLDLQNLIDFVQKKSILNTMCGYGMQSLNAWSIEDKIHLNGCLKKIGTWGRQNLLIIGGITTGLCLLEADFYDYIGCSSELPDQENTREKEKVNCEKI